MDSNENSRPASIQYSIWDTNKNNVKPIVPKKTSSSSNRKYNKKVEKHIESNKKVTSSGYFFYLT